MSFSRMSFNWASFSWMPFSWMLYSRVIQLIAVQLTVVHLNVTQLNVIQLNIIRLNAVQKNDVKLTIIQLSVAQLFLVQMVVVRLSVSQLNVLEPLRLFSNFVENEFLIWNWFFLKHFKIFDEMKKKKVLFKDSKCSWNKNTSMNAMRICHPPDGSTSPEDKLLCFITTNFLAKRRMH